MLTISYNNIITEIFKEVDQLLNNYIGHLYTTLAQHLKYPLGLAIILYISLLGLSISQGWMRLSVSEFVKSSIKISLIYSFALHWDLFSEWVVTGIENSVGQISHWLMLATPISIPQFTDASINGALQSILIEFAKVGVWVWRIGSWHNLAPMFVAVIIWIFGYGLILVAVFEIIIAKIMLALLFSCAPIFIALTLFKPLHKIFDRWLGAIIGFALMILFISAMLTLVLNVAQWAIAGNYQTHALHMNIVGFIPIMLVAFLGIGIMFKTAGLAQQIGGIISTISAENLWAGSLGGLLGMSLASFKNGNGKSSLLEKPETISKSSVANAENTNPEVTQQQLTARKSYE